MLEAFLPLAVEPLFDEEIRPAVINVINESFAVVGCMAWLSDTKVLNALSGCRCQIFTSDKNNNIQEIEKEYYSKIKPYSFVADGGAAKAIRIIRDFPEGGMAHHKFLVFINSSGEPFCAGAGSWNATYAASKMNKEDYTLIRDRKAVLSFYGRFLSIHSSMVGA